MSGRRVAHPPVAPPNGKPTTVPELAPAPVAPPHAAQPPASPRHRHDVSGGTLLFADLRTGFILMNAARYRAFERVLGLPREQVNIATLVAGAALAEAAHGKFRRLMDASTPSPGDLALGTTALRYAMLGPSAPAAPQTPVFGGLVVIALSATVFGPSVIRSARAITDATRGIGSAFARRYGRHARSPA